MARGKQACHSEERSDVGISQYPAASWESDRQNRNCLPEIATGAKRPRNDKLGGHHHFNDGLYRSTVLRRARLSAPLQRHVRSAIVPPNLQPAWRSPPVKGAPLHPILWRLPFSRQTVRVGSAQPGAACRSPTTFREICCSHYTLPQHFFLLLRQFFSDVTCVFGRFAIT